MKVNNVVLTRRNLAEMVENWEKELSQISQAMEDNEAQNKLNQLRMRMLNFILGCES